MVLIRKRLRKANHALERLRFNRLKRTLLGHKDPEKRRQAVERLRKMKERSIPVLVDALKDEDGKVREAAVWALVGFHKAAVPALVAALSAEDKVMRDNAADTLGWIRDGSTIDALGGVLDDEDPEVRMNAVEAVARLKEKGIPHLIKALGHADEAVRLMAELELGIIGLPAVPHLMKVLQHGGRDVQEGVSQSLEDIVDGCSMEELDSLEEQLKEGFAALQKHSLVRMKVARIMILISRRRNRLSQKRDMDLDDKPEKRYRMMHQSLGGIMDG